MGLFDFLIEDDFLWLSSQEEPEYTNWQTGQPDDLGTEDCGWLYSSGVWNDASCEWLEWAICEKPYAGTGVDVAAEVVVVAVMVACQL